MCILTPLQIFPCAASLFMTKTHQITSYRSTSLKDYSTIWNYTSYTEYASKFKTAEEPRQLKHHDRLFDYDHLNQTRTPVTHSSQSLVPRRLCQLNQSHYRESLTHHNAVLSDKSQEENIARQVLTRNSKNIFDHTDNEIYNELWMGWNNRLEKTWSRKKTKQVKIRVKLPHVNKNSNSEKRKISSNKKN